MLPQCVIHSTTQKYGRTSWKRLVPWQKAVLAYAVSVIIDGFGEFGENKHVIIQSRRLKLASGQPRNGGVKI